MALAPVLITIVIIALAIVAFYRLANFARSETERMRALEKYSDEYFNKVQSIMQDANVPTGIIDVVKEVGTHIGHPATAWAMHEILTKQKAIPSTVYPKVYEEFRASYPDLANKLSDALHAARLAWTFSNRKIGPRREICLKSEI
jgi:hypothetical protein